jgi:transcriptional regulator with XRE-family HTH domain
MSIADHLRSLRRERNLTLQQMADLIGLHLNRIRRYEIGETQPSLDALKKIALALSISTDALIFDDAERGPDEALKLKFVAIRQFDPDERKPAESVHANAARARPNWRSPGTRPRPEATAPSTA